MAELRVPTLQHLVRHWRDDPVRIKKLLLGMVKHSPTFSYSALYSCARELLLFKVPYDQVREGIFEKEKRPSVRENFLEILPLIESEFAAIEPDYVVDVAPQYYSIGRNLMVPFQPPLLYSTGGKQVLPWFIFWKSNPLSNIQTALFATMAKELMMASPDLEQAELKIFDFSVPTGAPNRILNIIPESELPILTENKRDEMLEKYAIAHQQAEEELSKLPSKKGRFREREVNENQADLFHARNSTDS